MKHKSAKLFETGDKSKYLSNVKAHLKTPAHSKGVAQYLENKEATMAKSEKNEVADKIKSMYNQIEAKYPGRFELMKIGASSKNVRCLTCNDTISTIPERGSAMHNIKEHIETCKASGKRKQGSIEFC